MNLWGWDGAHTQTNQQTKKTWTLTSIAVAAQNQNGQNGLHSVKSKMATTDDTAMETALLVDSVLESKWWNDLHGSIIYSVTALLYVD